MNKEEYRQYLTSRKWKDRREVALERAHHRCQLCLSDDNLNVHHNNYDNLGNEADIDLVVLCAHCHSRHHAEGNHEVTAWRYNAGIFARDVEACYSIAEILKCAFAWKEHVDSFSYAGLDLPGIKESCTEAIVNETGLSIRRRVDKLLDIYMETGRRSMSLVVETRMDAELIAATTGVVDADDKESAEILT
jgi:hypothetical protein